MVPEQAPCTPAKSHHFAIVGFIAGLITVLLTYLALK